MKITSPYKFLKYSCFNIKNKKNKIALGICVLNEGKKIRDQLRILSQKKINNLVDIIICDANSNDGSIDIPFLKKKGVNKLLLKRCSGKLSRQIQIIIHHSIKERYEGLILVDGNNKDDMKFIKKFIDKIYNKFDYVHGSRYIKNGYEKNTPIIRKLLTKYFHPFIFNIGNKFKFSDTANGYRGMSKKFIILNKEKIFKKYFIHYNLQYFLTRLSLKRNFKTCEIGVGRYYKKIHLRLKSHTSGIGYFIVLKDLILTKIGFYD